MANLPPSSCTMGLRSGGSTGSTVRIIHSGLLPLRRKASTTCSCLAALRRRCPEAERVSLSSSLRTSLRLMSLSSCRIASAPMSALKTGSNFCLSSRYWLSVSRVFLCRSLSCSISAESFSSSCAFSSAKPCRILLMSSTVASAFSASVMAASTSFCLASACSR
ncbi:hypothetical protein ES708_11244 [subsurface metagenome]